jgi:hypothetical protein
MQRLKKLSQQRFCHSLLGGKNLRRAIDGRTSARRPAAAAIKKDPPTFSQELPASSTRPGRVSICAGQPYPPSQIFWVLDFWFPDFLLALYFVWYNFVKIHKAHKLTPAMAADITDKLWSVEDIVALVEASEPKPGKRGPYKQRVA